MPEKNNNIKEIDKEMIFGAFDRKMPDHDVEFWYNLSEDEVKRLRKEYINQKK